MINSLEAATQGLIRVKNSAVTLTIAVQGLLRKAIIGVKGRTRGFTRNVGRMLSRR